MEYCRIKNLTVSYEDNQVLKDLSFNVKKGEIVLVAGSTGSGKSSLLHSINGVLPTYYNSNVSGDILIEEQSIIKKKIAKRSKLVGSVLQAPRDQIVFEKVDDELVFPMENLGFSKDKIKKNLNRIYTSYSVRPDDQTQTLSGGQVQTLVTEGTLVMGQDMVLLDEPLANLDYKSINNLVKRLENLKSLGKTVIMTEHRIDEILDTVDKVLWIEENNYQLMEAEEFKKSDYHQKNRALRTKFLSTGSDQTLIEVKDLSWNINGTQVLEDINLSINKGDKWVLLGDNGSGKTSLLNQIMKLIKPTSGSVKHFIDAKNIYKKIGYILQDPDYQLYMPSVYEEVDIGSINSQTTDYILESLDLKEYRNDHPHSLSQGQKRRLAVGAVLASKPEILIFDEPTVGQDQKSLHLILDTIKELYKDQELTMVTITHDRYIWDSIGDKYMLMEDGKLSILEGDDYEEYINSVF